MYYQCVNLTRKQTTYAVEGQSVEYHHLSRQKVMTAHISVYKLTREILTSWLDEFDDGSVLVIVLFVWLVHS